MYAVVKTGGKQYRVSPGETLRVESLTAQVGETVTLSDVLAIVGDGGSGGEVRIGTPLIPAAKVTATVVAHGRADKVTIFKMRRRKHSQKHQGHRQNFTELRIESIN